MIKGLLLENLSLKLFSLMLAILLELYFYSPDNSVRAKISASIQLRNIPSSMMVVEPAENEEDLSVKVTVKGPGPLVDQLQSANQKFIVDVPPGTTSTFEARFNGKQLRIPAGVEIIEIEPEKLDFRLEHVVTKELVVVAERTGEPPRGYEINELRIMPETVLARGPASELDGLNLVETQKIDQSLIRSSRKFEVPLLEKGSHTTLTPTSVQVEARVTPVMSEKSFQKLPIKVKAAPGFAAAVDPTQADITVSGPLVVLDSLAPAAVELYVDTALLANGRHALEISAQLPEGIKMLKVQPKEVNVTISATRND